MHRRKAKPEYITRHVTNKLGDLSFLFLGGKNLEIREFQEMMRRIYFHRDSERGTKGTFDWLTDEVRELGEALKEQDGKSVQNEFADVIAWLASLANIVNVDLETAALQKYDFKCPKCGKAPCECRQ